MRVLRSLPGVNGGGSSLVGFGGFVASSVASLVALVASSCSASLRKWFRDTVFEMEAFA